MPESIVAAAFSRIGKTVLHLDRYVGKDKTAPLNIPFTSTIYTGVFSSQNGVSPSQNIQFSLLKFCNKINFPIQHNRQNLHPSKMDLDFEDCFGRKKLCHITKEDRLHLLHCLTHKKGLNLY